MINKDDQIITAYAEPANGPGWANSPLWIIVKDINGVLREECLQPNQQTKEMRLVYGISAMVTNIMVKQVRDGIITSPKILKKR